MLLLLRVRVVMRPRRRPHGEQLARRPRLGRHEIRARQRFAPEGIGGRLAGCGADGSVGAAGDAAALVGVRAEGEVGRVLAVVLVVLLLVVRACD